MPQKFLVRESGQTTQKEAVATSIGAADAGKIPALGPGGKLHESMLPTGIGANTTIVPATEELSAGSHINLYSDTGAMKARLADNSNGRPADGFVKDAVTTGANATVYPLDEVNPGLTTLTPGAKYWLGTAGGVIATPLDETDPANAGKVSQFLGKAKSPTELITNDDGYVIL